MKMNEDELVHGLVNSLAFEVEAIPADNFIKFTSIKGTPLNVKVRVRDKDEPRLVQRGIVAVPKFGNHIASLEKIKLISSDQTILSFNVYMETELEKKSPPKIRKHGFSFFKFGGCLGTSCDDDEGPYLPGPSSKKLLKSKTSSKSYSDIHNENKDVANKLKLNLETPNAVTRNHKKLFGKCKPGGCLDPPFGEDKEPYGLPKTNSQIKLKHTLHKVENSKSLRISTEPEKSPKASIVPTTLLQNQRNKDVVDSKELLDIYARSSSLDHSPPSNYYCAIVTDSPEISSYKIINPDSDARQKIKKTSIDDSPRISYQYPESYFMPPKDILQHKEEERKYSRERSNDQILNVSNKNHENVNVKIPGQSTKLSKYKGKDNTEKIKQTLTDLTSNEMDNSQDYRKGRNILLNVTQNENITKLISDNKETPSSITYSKNFIDDGILSIRNEINPSTTSKSDPSERKEKEKQQAVLPKDQEAAQIISFGEEPFIDKFPDQEYLFKDTANKNVKLKENYEENIDPIQSIGTSKTVIIEEPKSEILRDSYMSSVLSNDENKVQIQQSLQLLDIPDHLPSDLVSRLEPFQIRVTTASKSKTANDQEKLTLPVRLLSEENLSYVSKANKKNIATPVAPLKEFQVEERKDTSINPTETKYANTAQKSADREVFLDHSNETQEVEDKKQINEGPNLKESEIDENERKSLLSYKSDKVLNYQNEQIQDSQLKNLSELESIKTNSTDLENNDKAIEEMLNNLDSKDMPNYDEDVEYDLKNSRGSYVNNKQFPVVTTGLKTSDKQVLEKQNLTTTQNYEIADLSIKKSNASLLMTPINEPVKEIFDHTRKANVADIDGENLTKSNTKVFAEKTGKLDDISTLTSFQGPIDLENFSKWSKESKYAKGNVDYDLTTSLADDDKSDDIKPPLAATTTDNRHSKDNLMDTSINNFITHGRNSNAGTELTESSINSIHSSENLSYDGPKNQEDNLDLKENEAISRNVNLINNDNVIITNDSLHDQNKNLSINIQDRIPSAILKKNPLIAKDETDLRNDDINVIKPFKRNTFTIISSNTSLQKQQEDISTQELNNIANNLSKIQKDKKSFTNDQTNLNVDYFDAQNYQRMDNGFMVESNQKTDTFLNSSKYDDTRFEINDRESNKKVENISKVPESRSLIAPENQDSNNAEVMSDKVLENIGPTEDQKKTLLASEIALSSINLIDNEILRDQELSNTKVKTGEELFNVTSSDLAKQMSELKDENDFESNVGETLNGNETLLNEVLKDMFFDRTGGTKTSPDADSRLRVSTEVSLKNESSDIPLNSDNTYNILTSKPIEETNDVTLLKTLTITNDKKSDTSSDYNAIKYESVLLVKSEFEGELQGSKNTLIGVGKSTQFDKNTEQVGEGNAEIDTKPIYKREKIIIKDDEDGESLKISDSDIRKSLKKIIDEKSLVPKDGNSYYTNENGSVIKVDDDGDLRKISDSNIVRSFNEINIKDGSKYISKNNTVTKVHEVADSKQILDRDTVDSFVKDIDKKLLVSKDGTTHYNNVITAPISENISSTTGDSGTRINTNIMKDDQIINQRDPISFNQQPAIEINKESERRLTLTDLDGAFSSKVKKGKSEVLLLNLAFQSYVNDNNETVVQTLHPLAEPLRHKDDTVTVIQSLIRHGNEIKIPVDVENDLSLKFMKKNEELPQEVNTSLHDFKKVLISRKLSEHAHFTVKHPEDVNKSLAFIYERELIPLHNIITNLTEEINTLSTQQELLKDKLRSKKRTRSLRLIPVIKRCGCGRI